jgi:hypothetical protein
MGLRLLLVMSTASFLIVVWENDVDKKGGLNGFKFMQVVLIRSHPVNKIDALLLKHMSLLLI